MHPGIYPRPNRVLTTRDELRVWRLCLALVSRACGGRLCLAIVGPGERSRTNQLRQFIGLGKRNEIARRGVDVGPCRQRIQLGVELGRVIAQPRKRPHHKPARCACKKMLGKLHSGPPRSRKAGSFSVGVGPRMASMWPGVELLPRPKWCLQKK